MAKKIVFKRPITEHLLGQPIYSNKIGLFTATNGLANMPPKYMPLHIGDYFIIENNPVFLKVSLGLPNGAPPRQYNILFWKLSNPFNNKYRYILVNPAFDIIGYSINSSTNNATAYSNAYGETTAQLATETESIFTKKNIIIGIVAIIIIAGGFVAYKKKLFGNKSKK